MAAARADSPLPPPTDADTALMQAVAAGAPEALAPLFERHHRRLYQHFERLVGERATAEDLVQETFARILRFRHTYRAEAPFVAWLFLLARNVANDHYRSRGRRADREVAIEVDAVDGAPHPLDDLARDEEQSRLRRALAALPVESRELLLLARFQALPYQEIARQLGVSEGAIKVRVHRAIKALRQSFLATESPATGADPR